MAGIASPAALLAASILLFCLSNYVALADYVTDDNDVIRVTGKVFCQDCSKGWKEWVEGSRPITEGIVSITCFDGGARVIYYNSDLTDNTGLYDIVIQKKNVDGKKLNPKACHVRLVSSPDPVCNIATNFGGGKSGVKLGRPTTVYRDLIKYTLGTFYYTTPMCEEPDTSEDGEETKNY